MEELSRNLQLAAESSQICFQAVLMDSSKYKEIAIEVLKGKTETQDAAFSSQNR